MTTKPARQSCLLRLLLLAAIGATSTACYFDGHFGGCHSHSYRSCAPIRFCR